MDSTFYERKDGSVITVSELIEILKKYPGDYTVGIDMDYKYEDDCHTVCTETMSSPLEYIYKIDIDKEVYIGGKEK